MKLPEEMPKWVYWGLSGIEPKTRETALEAFEKGYLLSIFIMLYAYAMEIYPMIFGVCFLLVWNWLAIIWADFNDYWRQ